MAPSCVVCGKGRILPCSRCGSSLDHEHLTVRGRDGEPLLDAPLCRLCRGTVRVGSRTLAEALKPVTGPLRRMEGAMKPAPRECADRIEEGSCHVPPA